jgi:hypothetical protein
LALSVQSVPSYFIPSPPLEFLSSELLPHAMEKNNFSSLQSYSDKREK